MVFDKENLGDQQTSSLARESALLPKRGNVDSRDCLEEHSIPTENIRDEHPSLGEPIQITESFGVKYQQDNDSKMSIE